MCILEPIEHNVTGLKLSLRWGDQNWDGRASSLSPEEVRLARLDCWDSRPHLGSRAK